MSAQFDPPKIDNAVELRTFCGELVKRITAEHFGIDAFTGRNNAGKSFVVRLIRYFAAYENLCSLGNIPHSPKENLNPRVLDKLQAEGFEKFQTHIRYFRDLDPFQSKTKTDLSNEPFSEVVELLRIPELFEKFSRVLDRYFISQGFLGDPNVRITIEKRPSCAWTLPELQAGEIPHVLCVDGEHFHWIGIGSDRILFMLASIFTTDYQMARVRWRDPFILVLDEPETGLSVANQRLLMNFLRDLPNIPELTRIKRVIVSTHSHVFLPDRLSANHFAYLVTRENAEVNQVRIHVKSIQPAELLQTRFEVLGLSLDDLLFEAILLVEGKHESTYLSRLFAMDGINAAIIPCTSSNAVVKALLQYQGKATAVSPTVVGLLDSPTKEEQISYDELKGKGCRYVVLDKPGIEYYYPSHLLRTFYESVAQTMGKHFLKVKGTDWLGASINEQIEFILSDRKYKTQLNESVASGLSERDREDDRVKQLLTLIKNELSKR